MDSDDWLYDNNVLQRLYDNITANNFPDVVRCPYVELRPDKKTGKPVEKIVRGETDINKIMLGGMAPWKNCHKSSFNIRFPENCLIEDIPYGLTLFDNVDINKITTVQTPCYVYNMTSNTSLWNAEKKSSELFEKSRQSMIRMLEEFRYSHDYCKIALKIQLDNLYNLPHKQ